MGEHDRADGTSRPFEKPQYILWFSSASTAFPKPPRPPSWFHPNLSTVLSSYLTSLQRPVPYHFIYQTVIWIISPSSSPSARPFQASLSSVTGASRVPPRNDSAAAAFLSPATCPYCITNTPQTLVTVMTDRFPYNRSCTTVTFIVRHTSGMNGTWRTLRHSQQQATALRPRQSATCSVRGPVPVVLGRTTVLWRIGNRCKTTARASKQLQCQQRSTCKLGP